MFFSSLIAFFVYFFILQTIFSHRLIGLMMSKQYINSIRKRHSFDVAFICDRITRQEWKKFHSQSRNIFSRQTDFFAIHSIAKCVHLRYRKIFCDNYFAMTYFTQVDTRLYRKKNKNKNVECFSVLLSQVQGEELLDERSCFYCGYDQKIFLMKNKVTSIWSSGRLKKK